MDPRSVLLTGLTRDGTFLIENGAIAGPCTNFRFNESPLAGAAGTPWASASRRTAPPEVWDHDFAGPPLSLDEGFTFSVDSPAVWSGIVQAVIFFFFILILFDGRCLLPPSRAPQDEGLTFYNLT